MPKPKLVKVCPATLERKAKPHSSTENAVNHHRPPRNSTRAATARNRPSRRTVTEISPTSRAG
ncbi:hypothetical protein Lesp01_64690 [Lentzea sp. NBRC 102530]|nr:hypothetical protein Lesp01_64690 [Lentzea sp. NBRC 102530]